MNKRLEDKLLRHNIKPTSMRLLVLSEVINSNKALSVKELENRLDRVDTVTLYRTLKTFEERNIIHSIHDGTSLLKYAQCEEGCECKPQDQHAHFHCEKCNETYCFPDIKIPENKFQKGFTVNSSSMIHHGICPECK